jgi:hypothetical protein
MNEYAALLGILSEGEFSDGLKVDNQDTYYLLSDKISFGMDVAFPHLGEYSIN